MAELPPLEEVDPDLEALRKETIIAEKTSYYSEGKNIDGSLYSCFMVDRDFLNRAVNYYGLSNLVREIERMREKNPKADPACGNWWLWAIFLRLGVAREFPTDDY